MIPGTDFSAAPTLASGMKGNLFEIRSTHLLILIVDVDQGECTILLERAGTLVVWCAIIDGGYSLSGRGAIVRYLDSFGVTQVDEMFCTHFDGDHTRGLTEYISTHAVKHRRDGGHGCARVVRLTVRNDDAAQLKSSTKLKLLRAAEQKGIEIKQAARGEFDLGVGPVTRLTCLHSNSDALQDENAGSIALSVEFGSFRHFTAGDLPSFHELGLLGDIGVIDTFKAGHHGSANSTPPQLIETCRPLAAFISAGRNSYGHPTYDVIERLGRDGTSLDAFYMTNCIHNRRLVNPHFLDQEKDLIEDYWALVDMGTHGYESCEAHDGPFVYDMDAIARLREELSLRMTQAAAEAERKLLTQRNRVLRAMERAAIHERAQGLRSKVIGHVAGDEAHLGTIAVHIPLRADGRNAEFHVGLLEEIEEKPLGSMATFVWNRHERGVGPRRVDIEEDYRYEDELEEVAEKLLRVVGTPPVDMERARRDYQQTIDEMSQAEDPFALIREKIQQNIDEGTLDGPRVVATNIPSSPRANYEEHVQSRYEGYQKFNIPTVVGLSQSRAAADLVPFCGLCYFDYSGEDPDFELVEVKEAFDGGIMMHRVCFWSLFSRLDRISRLDEGTVVPITREDAYDLTEFEITDPGDHYKLGFSVWTQWCRKRFLEALSGIGPTASPPTAAQLAQAIAKLRRS